MLVRFVLVASAAALFSSCSSHGGFGERVVQPLDVPSPTTSTKQVRGPARVIRVVAPGGLRFEPTEISLAVGETVTFVFGNRDVELHTFTVNELNLQMAAEAGETLRLTLAVPSVLEDRFEFYCSVAGHREGGMAGEIVLE
ncbi:MAG: plastocyanin/azurin family copper-binding protein [Actinomycetota bacterium]